MDIGTLVSNPYITLASFSLTILGLIFSVISIFYKGKRELSYTIRSTQVLQNVSVNGLLAQYLGNDIKDLTITYIAIWNSGSKTLRGDDIIDSKPMTLSSNSTAIILNTKIVEKTDLVSGINIKSIDCENKKSITIGFKDLGKKDGIILQVLHTGKASDLSMDCKIRDGKRLKSKGNMCISEETGFMDEIIKLGMLVFYPGRNKNLQLGGILLYSIKTGIGGSKNAAIHCNFDGGGRERLKVADTKRWKRVSNQARPNTAEIG